MWRVFVLISDIGRPLIVCTAVPGPSGSYYQDIPGTGHSFCALWFVPSVGVPSRCGSSTARDCCCAGGLMEHTNRQQSNASACCRAAASNSYSSTFHSPPVVYNNYSAFKYPSTSNILYFYSFERRRTTFTPPHRFPRQ